VSNLQEEINRNTIAIVSGNINGTYLSVAYDLSAVLDDSNNFRILPMIGKGAAQNIRDVRYLRGVDLGIAQSDLLGYFRDTRELGNLQDRIVYIAKLFNEELHIIVRDNSGITSIDQLEGKRVNVSDAGSGTQLSAKFMFGLLGIKFQEMNMGQADAFEKLKSNEIDATVLIAGKPAASMAKLRASDGYRILPVPYPKALQRDYLPATLTSQDYPNLIAQGREIETLAIGAVLIAYNWPKETDRYRRIAAFVERFFPTLAEFRKAPRHPKWRETNLTATLPGWNRFDAAEEWLRNNRAAPQAPPSREQFDTFVAARGANAYAREEDRERLFREFLKWNEGQGKK
jgi:TRAP transporter TAXI family solute receptor